MLSDFIAKLRSNVWQLVTWFRTNNGDIKNSIRIISGRRKGHGKFDSTIEIAVVSLSKYLSHIYNFLSLSFNVVHTVHIVWDILIIFFT